MSVRLLFSVNVSTPDAICCCAPYFLTFDLLTQNRETDPLQRKSDQAGGLQHLDALAQEMEMVEEQSKGSLNKCLLIKFHRDNLSSPLTMKAAMMILAGVAHVAPALVPPVFIKMINVILSWSIFV